MKLKIDGYRGHEGRSLNLAPNNLVVGKMGSGKSGLLHGLMIALLGYDPSLSAPGKKARPQDHLLFSKKGEMAITIEHGIDKVMRGYGKEKPVNRFAWHQDGFVCESATVDEWAQYSSGSCAAIYDVGEFTSLSDEAQLKFLGELLPEEEGGLEAQQALAHELCGDMVDVERAFNGLIHKDRNATISAWEDWVHEKIKGLRALADEAKKTIASLGDREAELAIPVDVDGMTKELHGIDARISEIRAVVAAKTERERHIVAAGDAIKRAESKRASLTQDPKALAAELEQLRSKAENDSANLRMIDPGSIKTARDKATWALREAEKVYASRRDLPKLLAAKAKAEAYLEDFRKRYEAAKAVLTDDLYSAAEAVERAEDLAKLSQTGSCPIMGSACGRAGEAGTRLSKLDKEASKKLESTKLTLKKNEESVENCELEIERINNEISRLPPAVPEDEYQRLVNDLKKADSDLQAIEAGIAQNAKDRTRIIELRGAIERIEGADTAIDTARQAFDRTMEAPCAEGSADDIAMEIGMLSGRKAELANSIESSRRAVAASEEVRSMAAKMRRHMDVFDSWKELQGKVQAVQMETTKDQVEKPRAAFLRIAKVLGYDLDMVVEDGELRYGLRKDGSLIHYRACSRGQKMLVAACLQYMFIDLVQPGIRVLLIDDAEALSMEAIGRIGAALKGDMAKQLDLDMVVVSVNDSISPSEEIEEKVNVIRL
jgi:hypothetical protein